MIPRTKPQGVWATFQSDCHVCGGTVTVTNSRPDPHTCRINLDWRADMDAYYDAGAKGAPPKHPLDNRT